MGKGMSDAPVFQLAAEIALCHHEKWDGSGYPNGLAGLGIPESARLVAVADVFDALTMKRAYRDAWPLDRVLETLRESSGSHLDPAMVNAFFDILPKVLDIRAQWDSKGGRQTALRANRDSLLETETQQGT
jgi:putative two-component system response regulator